MILRILLILAILVVASLLMTVEGLQWILAYILAMAWFVWSLVGGPVEDD